MRATAKLLTRTFQVQCPHCLRPLVKEDGETEFVPGELEPGSHITCDKTGCKQEFRMPTTMKAVIVDDAAARRGRNTIQASTTRAAVGEAGD